MQHSTEVPEIQKGKGNAMKAEELAEKIAEAEVDHLLEYCYIKNNGEQDVDIKREFKAIILSEIEPLVKAAEELELVVNDPERKIGTPLYYFIQRLHMVVSRFRRALGKEQG